MSSAVSILPPTGTAEKKRRPAFRPANQKKRAAKIQAPTKAEKNEIENVDLEDESTAHPPETQPKELAASHHNEAPEQAFPPAIPQGQLNDDGTAVNTTTLASFCSKYRSKDGTVKEVHTAPEPPPMLPEIEAPVAAGPVVQIINGEIVLQASSLVVSSARKTVAELEEEFDHVVEEEGHTAVVGASYNSFAERRKPQHWNVTETKLFYNALRQVGTDFACMEAYFENRTRKQLKRKYQIESSKNPTLIELALDPKAKVAIDLSVFNVDKDSIVITKATPIIHQPTTGTTTIPPPPPSEVQNESEDPTDYIVEEDETEMAPTRPIITMDSIFGDDPLFDSFKEIVEDTNMMETNAMAIPLLAPTQEQRVNKRPKFKARAKKK